MTRHCDFCQLPRPSLFSFPLGRRIVHVCAKHRPVSLRLSAQEKIAVRVQCVRWAEGGVV